VGFLEKFFFSKNFEKIYSWLYSERSKKIFPMLFEGDGGTAFGFFGIKHRIFFKVDRSARRITWRFFRYRKAKN